MPPMPSGADAAVEAGAHGARRRGQRARVRDDAADDDDDVGDDEDHEDGRERDGRLAHAADVERREADDEEDLERELHAHATRRGRKLKMTSPAAAIETVIVRT